MQADIKNKNYAQIESLFQQVKSHPKYLAKNKHLNKMLAQKVDPLIPFDKV